jgi:hypothetical protein
LKKHHIKAKQQWESFFHDGIEYCLRHLDAHEVTFKGSSREYRFVVTYGLHCFAKDNQEHSVQTTYSDGVEMRQINLERYHLSKSLREIVERLAAHKKELYQTTKEKYFIFEQRNDLTGKFEKSKVCICVFKENRLLRIHVTTAFFVRDNKDTPNKGFSIFKIAMDAQKSPRTHDIPKEASRK